MNRILVACNDPILMVKLVSAARDGGFPGGTIDLGTDSHLARITILREQYSVAVVHVPLEGPGGDHLTLLHELKNLQPHCRIICIASRPVGRMEVLLSHGADDVVHTDWQFIHWQNLLARRIKLWKEIHENCTAIRQRNAAST